LICFEEGRIAADSETAKLYTELTAEGDTGEMIESPDVVKYKNFCLEYQQYKGKTYCTLYDYIGDLTVNSFVQRKYIYPFVRFWMNQSSFGEEGLQILVDPSQCTSVADMFNPMIDSKHFIGMCSNKTKASMKILSDGYKNNFWIKNCPSGLNNNLIAEGEICGIDEPKYCNQDLFCRSDNVESDDFTCTTEANSNWNLTPNNKLNIGRLWDNNSIPAGCVPEDNSASTTNLQDRCFALLNDFYYWTHYEYESSETHLCTKDSKQVSGASENNQDCGVLTDTESFCDKYNYPSCVSQKCVT